MIRIALAGVWSLAVLWGAELAAAQSTTPTTASTAPATTPAFDQSTPKASLKTLAVALEAGDRAHVLSVLLASNEPERKLADAMAELAVVTRQLRDAAIKAYGAEQSRALGVDPSASAQALKRIDDATEELDAGKATVRPKESDGPPITLVLMDAVWRVPVAELTKDVEAAEVDRNLADVIRQSKLMGELSVEVSAGKFKSANDARQELDRRIMQSTIPTTQP